MSGVQTFPSPRTSTLSQFRTVFSRCAIINTVQPENSRWIVFWTAASVLRSTEAVASSSTRICANIPCYFPGRQFKKNKKGKKKEGPKREGLLLPYSYIYASTTPCTQINFTKQKKEFATVLFTWWYRLTAITNILMYTVESQLYVSQL